MALAAAVAVVAVVAAIVVASSNATTPSKHVSPNATAWRLASKERFQNIRLRPRLSQIVDASSEDYA
jgi:hypothetical protein